MTKLDEIGKIKEFGADIYCCYVMVNLFGFDSEVRNWHGAMEIGGDWWNIAIGWDIVMMSIGERFYYGDIWEAWRVIKEECGESCNHYGKRGKN